MTDFLLWVVLGGGIGFWYGQKRIKPYFQNAVSAQILATDPLPLRRKIYARLVGYKLGVSLFTVVLGAIAGAIIFRLGTLIASISN